MKKLAVIFFIIILMSSSSALHVTGSSAGDGDNPPPAGGGGGGGGGGSPQFYDYYVPLVFDENSTHGLSEVAVWIINPSVVITTFPQDEFGRFGIQYREPTKLVFNPQDNEGLTNGSLIRITSPSQVIGQRVTEDIYSDESFAYSILPRRMMGFEYYAPFDGQISILSLNQGTEIRVQSPSGGLQIRTIEPPNPTVTIDVEAGSYINSSYPTIGVFYTEDEGLSASMAVPRYLHGDTYYFDSDVTSPRSNEIDRSYLRINPSEPTSLTFFYANGSSTGMDIFAPTDFQLVEDLVGFQADRGTIEANMRIKYSYGSVTRSSTLQLMAIEEMRAAEIFAIPEGFSTHFAISQSNSRYNFSSYNAGAQSFIAESRSNYSGFERETLSINGVDNSQFIVSTNHLFGFSVLPGKASHPMDASAAFVNLPLNTQTMRNVTGLEATWYRFANLAVMRVDIIPGPLEEYTGQLIQIEIKANGTLPASRFAVEITIDEEVEVQETYDFLQVNELIIFNIRKFLPVGKQELNITVEVDVDDEVSEINEEDNNRDFDFNVNQNIRLRGTLLLIVLSLLGFGIYRFRKWLKQRKTVKRAHVDAILTFEEEA